MSCANMLTQRGGGKEGKYGTTHVLINSQLVVVSVQQKYPEFDGFEQ
jgi:hypothetical protein